MSLRIDERSGGGDHHSYYPELANTEFIPLTKLLEDVDLPRVKIATLWDFAERTGWVLSTENVFPMHITSALLAEEILRMPLSDGTALEIGTGSGFLAMIMAIKFSNVIATDIDPVALETARKNARRNGRSNITFLEGSVWEPLEKKGVNKKYKFILANPSALPQSPDEVAVGMTHGGEDGRNIIDQMLLQVASYLDHDGFFMLQHGSWADLQKTIEMLKESGLTHIKVTTIESKLGPRSSLALPYLLRRAAELNRPELAPFQKIRSKLSPTDVGSYLYDIHIIWAGSESDRAVEFNQVAHQLMQFLAQ